MTYELAKQLKDAGFPMKFIGLSNVPENNEVVFIDRQNAYEYPILEDIIEACGEKFSRLLYFGKNSEERGDWAAFAVPVYGAPSEYLKSVRGGVFANTPKEAVARLWIELHK